MLLSARNNHVFICGLTRSGKTYFTWKALDELPGPVLYLNIQGETKGLPKRFLTVGAREIDSDQLIEILRDGGKVNLILGAGTHMINVVIGYILELLMESGFSEEKPIYVAVDECHLIAPGGFTMRKAREVATAGLKKGVRCVWITQRPALADKTLYTQSAEQYIFYLSVSEASYMRTKGIDFETCQREWENRGKYSYVYYDGYTLEGRDSI